MQAVDLYRLNKWLDPLSALSLSFGVCASVSKLLNGELPLHFSPWQFECFTAKQI